MIFVSSLTLAAPPSHLFLLILPLDYFLDPFPHPQLQDHCLSLRNLILQYSPNTGARGVFLILVLIMSPLGLKGPLIPKLFSTRSNDLHNLASTYCNLFSPAPVLQPHQFTRLLLTTPSVPYLCGYSSLNLTNSHLSFKSEIRCSLCNLNFIVPYFGFPLNFV